jgi:hypothetical protein
MNLVSTPDFEDNDSITLDVNHLSTTIKKRGRRSEQERMDTQLSSSLSALSSQRTRPRGLPVESSLTETTGGISRRLLEHRNYGTNLQSEAGGYDLNNEYVRNEIVGKRDVLDEKENDSNYHSNVQTLQGADVTYIERKQDIPYVAKKSTTTEDARIIHSTPVHGATKTTLFADDGLFSGTQTSTELESMAFSAPGLQQHHNLGQSTFVQKHVQGQDFEQNDNDRVTNEKNYRQNKTNYDEHVENSDRELVQETSLIQDKGTRHGSHRINNESNEQSNTKSHSRRDSDSINTHVEVIQDFYNKQGAVERNANKRILEESKQEHTTTNMSTEVPIKSISRDDHMQHHTYHGVLEDEYRTYNARLSLHEQMNIPLGVETSRTLEDDHNGAILKSMLHKNCVEMEMTVQQLGSSIQSRLTSLKELNQYVDTSQLELNKSVTSDSSGGVDSSIASSDSSPRKVDDFLDKPRRSPRRKVDDSMSSFSDISTTRKKSKRRARTLDDSTSSISDASRKKSTRKRSKSASKRSSRDKLLREVKTQHDTSTSSVSDTSSETDSDQSTIPTYAEWAKMQNYGTAQRVLVDKSTSPDHLERPKVEEINYPIPPHLLGHNQYHDPRSLKSAYLLNENLVPERRDSSKDLTANSYLFHQAKESDMLSRYRSAIAAIDKSLLWDDCC